MPELAGRFRFGRRAARVLSGLVALGVAATLLVLLPADGTSSPLKSEMPRASSASFATLTRQANSSATSALPFTGVAAVGALFTEVNGKLGTHFCTASVVHSRTGDLALTAAHCVSGRSANIVFVPGYANGQTPFGIWPVVAVYTDSAWQASQDPDHDVAFLRLAKTNGVPIEDVTGAEQLGLDQPAGEQVQVIGYPDGADQPVWCANVAKTFSPTQLEFDCGGYPDGTSGSPFLTDVDPASGQGTVVGVIGGYEQGGDTPQVSYAAAFGGAVAALYQTAVADG